MGEDKKKFNRKKAISFALVALFICSAVLFVGFFTVQDNAYQDTEFFPHSNPYLSDEEREQIPEYISAQGLGGQYWSSGGQTFDETGDFSDPPFLQLFVQYNNGTWRGYTDINDFSYADVREMRQVLIRTPYGFYGIFCDENSDWGRMEIVTAPYSFQDTHDKNPLQGIFIRQWIRVAGDDYSRWLTTRTIYNETGSQKDPRSFIFITEKSSNEWVLGYNISRIKWDNEGSGNEGNLFSYNISLTVNYNDRFAKIGIDSSFGRSIDAIGFEFALATNPQYLNDEYGADYVLVSDNLIGKKYYLNEIADVTANVPDWIQVADIYDKEGRLRHRFDFRDFDNFGLTQDLIYRIDEIQLGDSVQSQYVCRVRGGTNQNLPSQWDWFNFDPSITTTNAESNNRQTRFGGDFNTVMESLLPDSFGTEFIATGNNGTQQDFENNPTTEGWVSTYGTMTIDTDNSAATFGGTFTDMTDTDEYLDMTYEDQIGNDGGTSAHNHLNVWRYDVAMGVSGRRITAVHVYLYHEDDVRSKAVSWRVGSSSGGSQYGSGSWYPFAEDIGVGDHGWSEVPCSDFTVPAGGSVYVSLYMSNSGEKGAWSYTGVNYRTTADGYNKDGNFISENSVTQGYYNWASMNVNIVRGDSSADIRLYTDSDADDVGWSYSWTLRASTDSGDGVTVISDGDNTGIDISAETEEYLRYKVEVTEGIHTTTIDDVDVNVECGISSSTTSGYSGNGYNLTLYEISSATAYLFINKTYDIGSTAALRNNMWSGFALQSGNLTDLMYVEFIVYDSSNTTLGTIRVYLNSTYSDSTGVDVVNVQSDPSVDTWYYYVVNVTGELIDSGGAQLPYTGANAIDDIVYLKVTFYVDSQQTHTYLESFFVDEFFFALCESDIDFTYFDVNEDAVHAYRNATLSGLNVTDSTPAADSSYSVNRTGFTQVWDTNKILYATVEFDDSIAWGIGIANSTDTAWIYFNYDDYDTSPPSNSSTAYYFNNYQQFNPTIFNLTYAIEVAQANGWDLDSPDKIAGIFFGEYSSGSDDSLVVKNFTIFDVDASEPPTITLNSPSAGSLIKPPTVESTTIDLLITDTGSGLDYAKYNWNGGSWTELTSPFDISVDQTMYDSDLNDESNTLYVWANDTINNIAQETFNFDVDKTDPTITLNSPVNETFAKGGTNIDLSVSDTFLDTVLYHWDIDDWAIFNSPYDTQLPTGDEAHDLYVTANDTSNNENNKHYKFTTDDTDPSITHSVVTDRDPNYPDDLDEYCYINATVTEVNLDTVFICHNVTGSFVNYTMNNEYGGDIYNYTIDIQSLSTGDRVEYLLYANDTVGNEGGNDNSGANFVFTLGSGDTDPPEITLDLPSNESIVTGETWFNFTINDVSSIEWFKINWNNGENITVADPYDHLNDTTSLSDGVNTLYTYANDSVGNIASEIYVFTVDNTAPSIILVDPSNSSTVEQYDSIDLAVTDLSSFTVQYNWNGGSNSSLERPYDLSMPYDSGTHYLYVYANDTHGFWNSKKYMFIAIVSPGTGGGGGGGGLEAIVVDVEYPFTFVVGDTVKITVYVNDTQSKPVSDLNVIAKYSSGIAVFEEITDGVYVTEIKNLKLGVNDLTIVVSKSGIETYEKRITIRGYESAADVPIHLFSANWMTNIWLYYGQTLIMVIIVGIGISITLFVAERKGLIEFPQIGLRKLKFPSIGIGRRKLKLPDIRIEKRKLKLDVPIKRRKIRKPSLPSKALPSRKIEKALFADRAGVGMNWMVFAFASIGISVWMLGSLFTSPQAAGAIWFYAFSLAVPLIVVSLYISWRLGEKSSYEPDELIFTSEDPFAAIIYGTIILVPISMLLFTISTYLATGINPFVMAPLHKQQTIEFPWGALSGFLVNIFLQFIVAAGENIALLILPTLIFDLLGVESRKGQMVLSASAFSAFHYFAAMRTVGIVFMFPYFFVGGCVFWLCTFGMEKGFKFPQGGFIAGFGVHLIANLMTISSASVLFV